MRRRSRLLLLTVFALVGGFASLQLTSAVKEVREARSEMVSVPYSGLAIGWLCRSGTACTREFTPRTAFAYYSRIVARGWRVARLLGQDSVSRQWICLLVDENPAASYAAVAALEGTGYRFVLRPCELSSNAGFRRVSLCDGRLVVPALEEGVLLLRLHSLNGRLVEERRLGIDGEAISALESPVDISRDGFATALIRAGRAATPEVCLFDPRGALCARLGSGGPPRFDNIGSRLAWPAGVMIGYQEKQRTGVVIYEVAARRIRRLVAWRPRKLGDALPWWWAGEHPSCVGEVQWTSDGRWLVCALSEPKVYNYSLVALDTFLPKPKRVYLPVHVPPSRWLVLTHVSGVSMLRQGQHRDAAQASGNYASESILHRRIVPGWEH